MRSAELYLKDIVVVQDALNALGMALASRNHTWSRHERKLYELATGVLDAAHEQCFQENVGDSSPLGHEPRSKREGNSQHEQVRGSEGYPKGSQHDQDNADEKYNLRGTHDLTFRLSPAKPRADRQSRNAEELIGAYLAQKESYAQRHSE